MCNLYTTKVSAAEVAAYFGATIPVGFNAGPGDVYPGGPGMVVREAGGNRLLESTTPPAWPANSSRPWVTIFQNSELAVPGPRISFRRRGARNVPLPSAPASYPMRPMPQLREMENDREPYDKAARHNEINSHQLPPSMMYHEVYTLKMPKGSWDVSNGSR
jgi:hypothetical protein